MADEVPEGSTPPPGPETGTSPAQPPAQETPEQAVARQAAVEAQTTAVEPGPEGGPVAALGELAEVRNVTGPGQEQAAQEGVPAPEPAAAGAGGAEINSDNVKEVLQENRAAQQVAQERLNELKDMSREELREEIAQTNQYLRALQGTYASPRVAAERPLIQAQINDVERRLRQLRAVQRERFGESQTASVTTEQQEVVARDVRTRVDDIVKLSRMSTTDLGQEAIDEQAKLDYLQTSLGGAITPAEKAAFQAQIRNAEARLKTIDELKGKKAPEEQRKKEEEEAKAKEEEKKRTSEELKGLQGKVGPVSEIEGLVNALQKEFDGLKGIIKKNAEDLEKATDDETRTRLREELAEYEKRAVEVGNRLVGEREALKTAQERVRSESGLKDKMSQENIRKMSVGEYLKLDVDERAKYLREVAEVTEPDRAKFDSIRRAIEAGMAVSIEKRALFVKMVADRLITEGRAGYDVRNLPQIQANFPEVYKLIVDRVLESDAAKKLRRERFPNNWEKIWDFAKKNPGWLMILLAILAGATAGAAALVGAGAAVATGAGGAAATGGTAWGASNISRR